MATQLAEQANEPDETVVVADNDAGEPQQRDYEAEARAHGWTSKEEFKGDPARWVDAETFAKRADEVMPFLQKQNKALKREIDDLKRNMKQFADFSSKAEERAYNRALADLQARHDEAVESGDKAAGRAILKELQDLKPAPKPETGKEPEGDVLEQRREAFFDWLPANPWYSEANSPKKLYADMLADRLADKHGGQLEDYPGGYAAMLAEITTQVERKFADPKPNPVNNGGNRQAANGGAKTWNDLPPAAKAQADRFVKTIPGFSREKYLKDYDWS